MAGPFMRVCFAVTALLPALPVAAQDAQGGGGDVVNLFFDCQAPGCRDLDFFRREAPWVNWVLDREVADVHVLVTSQQNGGGGRQYTLAFLGQAAPGRAVAFLGRHTVALLGINGLFYNFANGPLAFALAPRVGEGPLAVLALCSVVTLGSLAVSAPLAAALDRWVPQLVGRPRRRGPWLPGFG